MAIAGGAVWTQVVETGGADALAWQRLPQGLGDVLWPRSVTRTFRSRDQLTRYLERTFPAGAPRPPAVDFASRRLVLIAAGPRSSTGYGVRIVSVTERRGGIRIVARETTPSLDERAIPRLTSPYALVTIPAPAKPVRVVWRGRS